MKNEYKFGSVTGTILYETFNSGRHTCLMLYGREGPLARLCVNLPELQDGEIAVDYNNLRHWWEDVTNILFKERYYDTGKSYRSGFCEYPVWRKRHPTNDDATR